MSKYIVGYTDYEYVINGVFIPKHNYNDAEKAKGKLGYTEIDDSKLAELQKVNVFNSLIDLKKIRVMDHKPSWAVSAEDKANAYKSELEAVKAELEATKQKLAESNQQN